MVGSILMGVHPSLADELFFIKEKQPASPLADELVACLMSWWP